MRPARLVLLVILLFAVRPAVAQEEPKPDQLKKMYDDALAQLKTAQDRRNELAMQNDQLNAKIKELAAKLAAAEVQLNAMKQEAAQSDEKTFFLRSHYAAWQAFLQRYPELLAKWKLFLGTGIAVPNPTDGEDQWPFSAAG